MAGSGQLFGVTPSETRNMVEFRAGKMSQNGKTVSADKRKGKIYLYRNRADSLMHFCWKDRTSGTVEDDFIIFPEDAVFVRVPECTTGRVFVLKFKASSKRCFYWMQEPKVDRDEEYCLKLNQFLNNTAPSEGGASTSETPMEIEADSLASSSETFLSNIADMDLPDALLQHPTFQNLVSQFRNQQVVRIGNDEYEVRVGNARNTPAQPASSSQPTTSTATATRAVQLDDLQSILSSLNLPNQAESSVAPLQELTVDVIAETLRPLLENEKLMTGIRQALSSLPNADNDDISSSDNQAPQFQKDLKILTAVLEAKKLGPVLEQFVSAKVVTAAESGDMKQFVKALQEESNQDVKPKEKEEA